MVIIAVLVSGCRRTTRTIGRGTAPKRGQISQVELRDELNRFEYIFMTAMKQGAEDMEKDPVSRRIKRTNIQMQSRVTEALHAMLASDDPVVAFFDTWALIIRLRLYLEEGQGKRIYGELQQAAIAFISLTEIEIERIGQLLLKPDQFEEVKRNLEVFAFQHPITGTYANLVVYATQERKEEAGALIRTLSIPMAPIRAMEGVDNTATAIHSVSDSVDRFTNAAEQLPESARWQMSILMDDFEESEISKSFLTSLNEFSQSSAKFVEVLDSMPAEIRTELLTALEASDESQQQLRATMQTAVEAASQLEKTMAEFQKTTMAVDQTAAQATNAGVAWKDASDSIQDLVMLFKNKTPRPPDAPPPFGMHDFDQMLTNAGQTADKVTNAITELQQTIDSAAKAQIQKELRSLVDHIMIRLFELALAIMVLIGVYRYIRKKMA
jgi:uncharacterized protein YukE